MFAKRIVLGVLSILMLFGAQGLAHDKEVDRTLFIQIDDKGIVALWGARSNGTEMKLQGTLVDLDRNGKFSDGEKKLLAAGLLSKGMAGVSIRYAGEGLPKPKSIETKLKDRAAGTDFVEALGMASYEIPVSEQESSAIEIAVDKGYGPVTVQVQTLGERFVGWVNRAPVALDRKGLKGATQLKAGETLKVVVVKGHAPKPKVRKDVH